MSSPNGRGVMSLDQLMSASGAVPSPEPAPEALADDPHSAAVDPAPDSRHRYVLVLYQVHRHGAHDMISPDLAQLVRDRLEEAIHEPRENVELDVWLESPGGDLHSAYKIVLLMRAFAHRVRVVIPDYAKSAATLIALAADEIVMAPSAELGPLDAQIGYEQAGVTVSALDVARSLDDLADTALNLALQGGAATLNVTRLGRKDAMAFMLDFSAKFIEPMVSQLDPTMVHRASQLLKVSVQYAERVLCMREQPASADAGWVAHQLVEQYPTHGYVISPQEARDNLRLPVTDADDYDLWQKARTIHRQLSEEHGGLPVGLVVKVNDPQDDSDVDAAGQGSSDDREDGKEAGTDGSGPEDLRLEQPGAEPISDPAGREAQADQAGVG